MRIRLPLLAIAALALGLAGCSQDADIVAADTSDYAPDGVLELDVGRITGVWVYDLHQGFSSQVFQCDGEHDHVETSDPSIVALSGAHYREAHVVGQLGVVMEVTVTALRAGEATLTATCSGHVAGQRVRVVDR